MALLTRSDVGAVTAEGNATRTIRPVTPSCRIPSVVQLGLSWIDVVDAPSRFMNHETCLPFGQARISTQRLPIAVLACSMSTFSSGSAME